MSGYSLTYKMAPRSFLSGRDLTYETTKLDNNPKSATGPGEDLVVAWFDRPTSE